MVKYKDQWGTVCDDNFGSTEAQSACHSLGLSGGSSETVTYNGPEPFLMDDVDCSSATSSFLSCSQKGWTEHNCGSSEHVLLTCT